MKKETIYYLVGGAAVIGLGIYAYKKNKGNVDVLHASIITGDSVPVNEQWEIPAQIYCITAPCGSPSQPTVIKNEDVKKLPVATVKEISKSNPEILAQVSPVQAVEIINTTPAIKAIIPRVVQEAIKQAAVTGSTAPAATVAPSPAPTPVTIVTPLPASPVLTRGIVTTPVVSTISPVVSTTINKVTGGSSGAETTEKPAFMKGLGFLLI